jgi:hypothetical protein
MLCHLEGPDTMSIQDRHDRRVSLRLEQVLRVYCTELSPTALTDLRDALRAGHHAWFRHEFAEAIVEEAFTPEFWHEITATHPLVGVREDEEVRRQQRLIWQVLFVDEVFPAGA